MRKRIITKTTDIQKLEQQNMKAFAHYLAYLLKKYKDQMIEKTKEG